jgi:hypothetical protein
MASVTISKAEYEKLMKAQRKLAVMERIDKALPRARSGAASARRENVTEARQVLATTKNPRFRQLAHEVIQDEVKAVAPTVSRRGTSRKINPRNKATLDLLRAGALDEYRNQSDIRVYTKSPCVVISIENLKNPKLGKGRFDWSRTQSSHKPSPSTTTRTVVPSL